MLLGRERLAKRRRLDRQEENTGFRKLAMDEMDEVLEVGRPVDLLLEEHPVVI